MDLTRRDMEVETVERTEPSEPLDQPIDLDGRRHGVDSRRSASRAQPFIVSGDVHVTSVRARPPDQWLPDLSPMTPKISMWQVTT